MAQETCNSAVELGTLAAGMAKQHESYQDALQELLDNAVSSIVQNEDYFTQPKDNINIVISLLRKEDSVTTVVADNGPGISHSTVREEIFRTGNKEASSGILNNVGWGLKASLAWFEQTIREADTKPADPWFKLITKRENGEPIKVNGPITGDLPLIKCSEDAWPVGIREDPTDLDKLNHGTRVHATCTAERFNADVWPKAQSLEIKAQALRERLGVLLRRLLNAREDNEIYVTYHDFSEGESGTLPVVPIAPEYLPAEELDSGTEHSFDEFTISTSRGRYDIKYERGTLDYGTMTSKIAPQSPGLLTEGGNFRVRYRPSQTHQGIDIYANGRVLMTSVFSELFDLARNNQYNYFGGRLRIIPHSPESTEVPTDNKKTRLDANSQLWQELVERLSTDRFQPEGRLYGKEVGAESQGSESDKPEVPQTSIQMPAERIAGPEQDGYGLYQGDARYLTTHLNEIAAIDTSEPCFDLTLTSPPYADLLDYGYDAESQIGTGDDYATYLETLRDIFKQIYDLTRQDGSLWVVVNSFSREGRVIDLPADIIRICQGLDGHPSCEDCSTPETTVPLEPVQTGGPYRCPNCGLTTDPATDGWQLQDIVVWDKQRALPYTDSSGCRNVFEYILGFSKSTQFSYDLDAVRIADPSEFEQWWVDYPERYHPRGKAPTNIWEMTTPTQGGWSDSDLDHPAPFPPELVTRILRLATDRRDVVFDPFAGSGTVLAQADAMDRNPLGFELSQEYCDLYSDVRGELLERWEDTNNAEKQTQQRELARIIGGLRQLKQARELIKQIADAQQVPSPVHLDLEALFQVCNEMTLDCSRGDLIVKSQILLGAESDVTPRRAAQLETLATEILQSQPLSQYGISTTVSVEPLDSICRKVENGGYQELADRIFVYRGGRHYEFAKETTLQAMAVKQMDTEIPESDENIQPIISNVGLQVRHPRRSYTAGRDENLAHKLRFGSKADGKLRTQLSISNRPRSESD